MSSASAEGLTALSSVLLGLSTIAVGLRFYARHLQKAPLKIDDWIMLPCLILFIGTVTCSLSGVRKRVMGYPTPKDLKLASSTALTAAKLYITFDFFNISTLGFVKIGALLFYRRIFCVQGFKTKFNHLTASSIVIVVLWIIAFLLLAGLQCGVSHFSALWHREEYEKYCSKISYPFLLGLAISDFVLDVWVMLLPVNEIWALRTSVRRRIGVTGIFLLATVGLAACIARLAIFVQTEHTGPTDKKVDPRLVNTRAIYFSILEAGLSLIAVNLPSLHFLSHKVHKPESFLRSVRSMISLRSENSHKADSRSPKSSLERGDIAINKSGGTKTSDKEDVVSVEAYAVPGAKQEEEEEVLPLPEGRIKVQKRIERSEDAV